MIQTLQPTETNLTTIVRTIIELCKGHSNSTGTVTLTSGATTTTVQSPTCSETSVVFFSERTANAAAERGNGTMYVTPGRGQFIITHANNSQSDRTFGWHVAS